MAESYSGQSIEEAAAFVADAKQSYQDSVNSLRTLADESMALTAAKVDQTTRAEIVEALDGGKDDQETTIGGYGAYRQLGDRATGHKLEF